MNVVEGLLFTFALAELILLVLIMLLGTKILEGVQYILSICHADIVEDNPPPEQHEMRGPGSVPAPRSLMDIVSQPPTDTDTGTFSGRQPWGPPPEPPEKV